MTKRFYVDTAIWMDYYQNRTDLFRSLGELAKAFLKKALEEGWVLFYSKIVIDELQTYFTDGEIREMFYASTSLLHEIEITNVQWEEAELLAIRRVVPFGDAVHAILARDAKAIVITRDLHFKRLQDIVPWKKPEDLR